ncbi:hypothetical protein T492DRAFT_885746, partial [Pavlovales sp. CCMP2436]
MHLVFHLADTTMRHAMNKGVTARVKADPKSFAEFSRTVNDKDFLAQLERARLDPKGQEARKVMERVLRFISFMGSHVPFSSQMRKSTDLVALLSSHRAFGPGNIFLSIALDDVHDPWTIHMAYPHVSTGTFPAVSDEAFLAALQGSTPAERVAGGWRMDETSLQKLAAISPVATTFCFNFHLQHVFEHLIGVNPRAKTRKPVDALVKGIFGTVVGYNFVKETNKRESEHAHGQLHGGVLPEFMSAIAHVPRLVDAALAAIDTQVCSEISTEAHAISIALKELKVAKRRDAAHEIPLRPGTDNKGNDIHLAELEKAVKWAEDEWALCDLCDRWRISVPAGLTAADKFCCADVGLDCKGHVSAHAASAAAAANAAAVANEQAERAMPDASWAAEPARQEGLDQLPETARDRRAWEAEFMASARTTATNRHQRCEECYAGGRYADAERVAAEDARRGLQYVADDSGAGGSGLGTDASAQFALHGGGPSACAPGAAGGGSTGLSGGPSVPGADASAAGGFDGDASGSGYGPGASSGSGLGARGGAGGGGFGAQGDGPGPSFTEFEQHVLEGITCRDTHYAQPNWTIESEGKGGSCGDDDEVSGDPHVFEPATGDRDLDGPVQRLRRIIAPSEELSRQLARPANATLHARLLKLGPRGARRLLLKWASAEVVCRNGLVADYNLYLSGTVAFYQ